MKFSQSNLLNSYTNMKHIFTTRASGNLAFHVNDDLNTVLSNHKLLVSELNYDKNRLIHMKQIHSDIVHIVNERDSFQNPPICDALITDRLDTPLMVMVADCSPILFYDPKLQVISVAHAGRQGAFKNIVKNVIDTFTGHYNSKVGDIIVSISSSIGSCCYEVGGEIYAETKDLNLDYSISKVGKSYYLDIRKILKTQLLASGIKSQNIEISDECSCCNSDKYFSYRADRKCGRFSGIIWNVSPKNLKLNSLS